jgi:hypothetical protein
MPGFDAVHEPEKGFVYQARCFKSLPRWLVRQFPRRQRAQLVVHQRQQLLGNRWVAGFDGRQDAGHITHVLEDSQLKGESQKIGGPLTEIISLATQRDWSGASTAAK